SPRSFHFRGKDFELFRSLEVRLGPVDVAVVRAANVAYAIGVVGRTGQIGSHAATRAVSQLFGAFRPAVRNDIYNALANAGERSQAGFNLAKFHADATDFHLIIRTTQKFHHAIGAPPSKVTRLVQAQRWPMGGGQLSSRVFLPWIVDR